MVLIADCRGADDFSQFCTGTTIYAIVIIWFNQSQYGSTFSLSNQRS